MAKAKELTDKQEAACQAYIEFNGHKSNAYRKGYDCENMSDAAINVEACRLFKTPNIALRVLELQEEHRERHNVTVDTITAELDEAKDLAKECEQPAAMTGAIMGKAKIHGLVTDKKELTGKDGAPIEAAFNFIPVTSKKGD
jgi:hypothetical protein